jgi:hypothetical protein
MANIFTLDNINDFSEKINLDELYEKKKQFDLNRLELYNKILNRIHVKIKTTSRQKIDEQFCWFVIPEIIIGIPKYDQADCIGYLFNKLKENGFAVKYYHPNTLFICWNHFVPSYVRNELKKKTGIVIDEYGNPIKEEETDGTKKEIPNNLFLNQTKINKIENKNDKKFTPINTYKPTGNFIYNKEQLSSLEKKIS